MDEPSDEVDEPRWLDDREREAWLSLTALMLLLPAALDAHLMHEAELTGFSYFVMAMLSEAPGHATTMSDLAVRSHASPSRLSHVVTSLEARGWVERRRCSHDGRVVHVSLTEPGWESLVAIAPRHVANVRRLVFDALDEDDVVRLAEIATKIRRVLDPERTFGPSH
jgi:DNA-binding MarR family transcriptional regulator